VERNLLVSELSVNSSKSFKLALNVWLLLGVQEDLQNSLSVSLNTGALSDDFSRVDNILQNGILHVCQGAGAWTRSLGLCSAREGLAQDGSLGNDDDVTAGELLFQFTHQSLLNLVERLEQLVWNVENNSLLITSAINILGGSNVQVSKRRLKLGRGHLKVEKFLSNRKLELIWFLVARREQQYVRKRFFISSLGTAATNDNEEITSTYKVIINFIIQHWLRH
jgi:hypothetical protein